MNYSSTVCQSKNSLKSVSKPVSKPMRSHNSAGFTLLELMISMLLGIFVVTGAYQVSIVNQQAKHVEKNAQQTQKNGRFAMDQLSKSIKLAGYTGFYGDISKGVENVLKQQTDLKWNFASSINGYDNVNASTTVAGITGFEKDTDVLLLRGMKADTASVVKNTGPSSFDVDKQTTFSVGDVVLAADVNNASLFQVTGVTNNQSGQNLSLSIGGPSPGNSGLLENGFTSNSEIGQYDVQVFYIKNGRNDKPALFKASLINTSGVLTLQENELTSNVDDMQISYGIDTNNDQKIDEYRDASDITEWQQLVSVKLVLLLESGDDFVLNQPSSYSYNPDATTFVRDTDTVAEANTRIKRVFRTHVPLQESRS